METALTLSRRPEPPARTTIPTVAPGITAFRTSAFATSRRTFTAAPVTSSLVARTLVPTTALATTSLRTTVPAITSPGFTFTPTTTDPTTTTVITRTAIPSLPEMSTSFTTTTVVPSMSTTRAAESSTSTADTSQVTAPLTTGSLSLSGVISSTATTVVGPITAIESTKPIPTVISTSVIRSGTTAPTRSVPRVTTATTAYTTRYWTTTVFLTVISLVPQTTVISGSVTTVYSTKITTSPKPTVVRDPSQEPAPPPLSSSEEGGYTRGSTGIQTWQITLMIIAGILFLLFLAAVIVVGLLRSRRRAREKMQALLGLQDEQRRDVARHSNSTLRKRMRRGGPDPDCTMVQDPCPGVGHGGVIHSSVPTMPMRRVGLGPYVVDFEGNPNLDSSICTGCQTPGQVHYHEHSMSRPGYIRLPASEPDPLQSIQDPWFYTPPPPRASYPSAPPVRQSSTRPAQVRSPQLETPSPTLAILPVLEYQGAHPVGSGSGCGYDVVAPTTTAATVPATAAVPQVQQKPEQQQPLRPRVSFVAQTHPKYQTQKSRLSPPLTPVPTTLTTITGEQDSSSSSDLGKSLQGLLAARKGIDSRTMVVDPMTVESNSKEEHVRSGPQALVSGPPPSLTLLSSPLSSEDVALIPVVGVDDVIDFGWDV